MLSKFYLLITNGLRVGVALGVFLLLTRVLGPETYGLVSIVFAYASIGSLVSDFGFNSKALREIAADPPAGKFILLEVIHFKMLLTTLVCAVGLVAILLLDISAREKVGAGLLGLGVLANSFGNLGTVGLRAVGLYRRETIMTVWTTVLYGAFTVIAVVFWQSSLIAISAAFLISRLIYAVAALLYSFHALAPIAQDDRRKTRSLAATALNAGPWALDNAVGTVTSQLDALLLVHVASLGAIGIYQAGVRIIDNSYTLAFVLAAVHVPALSGAFGRGEDLSKPGNKVLTEFFWVGLAVGVGVACAGPIFTKTLLTSSYAPLIAMWPSFACLIFLRFISGGQGVLLTATGQVGWRIAAQVGGGIFVLLIFFGTFHLGGVASTPWVMCAGAAVTCGINWFGWRRRGRPQVRPVADVALR